MPSRCPIGSPNGENYSNPLGIPLALAAHDGCGQGGPCSPEIRVLHIINGEHYAGAERVQDLLAARLPAEGFEVSFVCLKGDQFPERRKCRSAALWNLRMEHRFDLRPLRRIIDLVREKRFSLIHCHTPRTALFGKLVAARTGIPLVYHVHSPTANDTTHRWRNRINSLVERLATSGRTHCITVSHSLARHMVQQGIAAERLAVVPNGVPCASDPLDRSAPTGEWRIGTVALFRPRKGLEVLLESLRHLRDAGLPVRLRAVGSFETPEYQARIQGLAESLGVEPYVEWTGFSSDVPGEMRKLDVLVLPSLFGEGLPMVVLEAMALGLPVVATRVEGIPEAIGDETDGLLAPPGDSQALAARLGGLVRGAYDYQALARCARLRQIESFSDTSMAGGVARLYRKLLSQAKISEASD